MGGGGCQTADWNDCLPLFLPHLFFVTRQERRVFCLSHVCASDRCIVVYDLSVQ